MRWKPFKVEIKQWKAAERVIWATIFSLNIPCYSTLPQHIRNCSGPWNAKSLRGGTNAVAGWKGPLFKRGISLQNISKSPLEKYLDYEDMTISSSLYNDSFYWSTIPAVSFGRLLWWTWPKFAHLLRFDSAALFLFCIFMKECVCQILLSRAELSQVSPLRHMWRHAGFMWKPDVSCWLYLRSRSRGAEMEQNSWRQAQNWANPARFPSRFFVYFAYWRNLKSSVSFWSMAYQSACLCTSCAQACLQLWNAQTSLMVQIVIVKTFLWDGKSGKNGEMRPKVWKRSAFNVPLQHYLIQETALSYLYVRRRVRDSLEHVFWERSVQWAPAKI